MFEQELHETVDELISKGLAEAYERNGETCYRLTAAGAAYFACSVKDSELLCR